MRPTALPRRAVRRLPSFALAAVAAVVLAPAVVGAQAFTDAAGDLRAAYTGPRTGDLDVTGGAVAFDGVNFLFRGTMAGPINPAADPNLAYVYGVNRGAGTARFAALGVPGVLFDAVVIVRPNGPDVVNLFTSPATPLSAGAVTITGNTFEALVPAALLPPTGFAFADYTFNLWPRFGLDGAQSDAQISDFGPNNSNVAVAAVVPEPATLLLAAPALAGLALLRRRARGARV